MLKDSRDETEKEENDTLLINGWGVANMLLKKIFSIMACCLSDWNIGFIVVN